MTKPFEMTVRRGGRTTIYRWCDSVNTTVPLTAEGEYDWERFAAERPEMDRRANEMLESGARNISLNTDAVFLEGHCNNSQLEKMDRRSAAFLSREAEQAGVNVKGKVYLSSLAAYPGDPFAWVDGKGDVQRVCERRNWNCDGAVKVQSDNGRQVPQPDPAKPLGGEVVE